MAISERQLNNNIKAKYIEEITNFLEQKGEEVLKTNNNEICLPCVDEEGNEKFLQIVFKIPKGQFYGKGEPFDGYEAAENYKIEQEQNRKKQLEKEEQKKKKIERDKKIRAEAKKIKEAEKEKRGE